MINKKHIVFGREKQTKKSNGELSDIFGLEQGVILKLHLCRLSLDHLVTNMAP